MLRFVLTVAVLTHRFTLACFSASQDCVDVMVSGNSSTHVKSFISKEGELLFHPAQEIILFDDNDKSIYRITGGELFATDPRWHSLEVTVYPASTYHQCTLKQIIALVNVTGCMTMVMMTSKASELLPAVPRFGY